MGTGASGGSAHQSPPQEQPLGGQKHLYWAARGTGIHKLGYKSVWVGDTDMAGARGAANRVGGGYTPPPPFMLVQGFPEWFTGRVLVGRLIWGLLIGVVLVEVVLVEVVLVE